MEWLEWVGQTGGKSPTKIKKKNKGKLPSPLISHSLLLISLSRMEGRPVGFYDGRFEVEHHGLMAGLRFGVGQRRGGRGLSTNVEDVGAVEVRGRMGFFGFGLPWVRGLLIHVGCHCGLGT